MLVPIEFAWDSNVESSGFKFHHLVLEPLRLEWFQNSPLDEARQRVSCCFDARSASLDKVCRFVSWECALRDLTIWMRYLGCSHAHQNLGRLKI